MPAAVAHIWRALRGRPDENVLLQDVTPSERIEADPKVDRDVTIFGYLRGTNMKLGAQVHIAGVGDYTVSVPSLTGFCKSKQNPSRENSVGNALSSCSSGGLFCWREGGCSSSSL